MPVSETVKIIFKGDTSELEGQLLSLGNIAGSLAFAGIADQIKDSVMAASDLNESFTAINSVSGESVKNIKETVHEMTGLGLKGTDTATMMKTLAGGMKQVHFSSQQINAETDKYLKRSADIQSFWDVSSEQMSKMTHALFSDDTESWKQVNVHMTQANLDLIAQQEMHKKNYRSLTQQEKVAAKLQEVYKDTAITQGDFSKTKGSLANEMREFSAKWQEIAAGKAGGSMHALAGAIDILNKNLEQFMNIGMTIAAMWTANKMLKSPLTRMGENYGLQTFDRAGKAAALKSELKSSDELMMMDSLSRDYHIGRNAEINEKIGALGEEEAAAKGKWGKVGGSIAMKGAGAIGLGMTALNASSENTVGSWLSDIAGGGMAGSAFGPWGIAGGAATMALVHGLKVIFDGHQVAQAQAPGHKKAGGNQTPAA